MWQEEEFFYKINRELIDQNRMDQSRARQMAAMEQLKCPKCFSQMKESYIGKIWVNRCLKCKGVFFEAKEFEALTSVKEHGLFFKMIKNSF